MTSFTGKRRRLPINIFRRVFHTRIREIRRNRRRTRKATGLIGFSISFETGPRQDSSTRSVSRGRSGHDVGLDASVPSRAPTVYARFYRRDEYERRDTSFRARREESRTRGSGRAAKYQTDRRGPFSSLTVRFHRSRYVFVVRGVARGRRVTRSRGVPTDRKPDSGRLSYFVRLFAVIDARGHERTGWTRHEGNDAAATWFANTKNVIRNRKSERYVV